MRGQHRLDLAGARAGMSPGMVIMPPRPSAAAARRPALTLPVWPSRAPSVTTRAPMRASAVACGSSVTTRTPARPGARQRRPAPRRSSLGRGRRSARRQQRREALLRAVELLDRHDRPDVAAHPRSESANVQHRARQRLAVVQRSSSASAPACTRGPDARRFGRVPGPSRSRRAGRRNAPRRQRRSACRGRARATSSPSAPSPPRRR